MKRNCFTVLALLIAFWAGPAVAQTYTFTTLNSPGGGFAEPEAIDGNNVVGSYVDSSGTTHGFLYDGTTFTTLNPPSVGKVVGNTWGISGNNIVGNCAVSGGFAYLYNIPTQTYTTLNGPLAYGGIEVDAVNGNYVAGSYEDSSQYTHGFVYNISSSTYTTLDDPLAGGLTIPTGISGNTIVGEYQGPGLKRGNLDVMQGFLYNMSTQTYTTLDEPLGVQATWLTGISGNDISASYEDSGGHIHGCLYDESTSTWLAPLDDPLEGQGTFSATHVQGISGSTLVGWYVNSAGNGGDGFVATVPEPSTFVLLSVGVVVLVSYRWRARKKPTSQQAPPIAQEHVAMKRNCLTVLALLMGFCVSPVVAQTYAFTTIDDPLGAFSQAKGIDGTNIVGTYADSSNYHGFLYNGTTYTPLNDPSAGTYGTLAEGISGNNIVGVYYDSSNHIHGFLFNDSTDSWMTLDDPLGTGYNGTSPQGIVGNNIVGTYDNSTTLMGFVYNISSQTYTTLSGPTGSGCSAFGISGNNIVGTYSAFGGSTEGFLYNTVTQTYTTLNGPPGGTTATWANGMFGNSVVGSYLGLAPSIQGFLYDDSTLTWKTLDDPFAGTTFTGNQGTHPQSISGNTIVGYYVDSSNATHAFVATVPEPSTFVLLSVGAVVLIGYRWRAQKKGR